jgi:hypothetical protein
VGVIVDVIVSGPVIVAVHVNVNPTVGVIRSVDLCGFCKRRR